MADDANQDEGTVPIKEILGLEDEPELDVQVEGEAGIEGGDKEDKKPDVVTLTPEEFAALKGSGDTAQAVLKGFEALGNRLGPGQQHPNAVNTPQQTPEEFFAEHADDLFDKEKGGKTLTEYSKRIIEREYGPLLASISKQLSATRKELLETKDPMFKKYSGEIEELVRAQPQSVQMQPDIYERAWLTVREKHRSEIEEEATNAKVEALLDAKLKELGIDPKTKKGSDARPAAYVNSEARSTPASGVKRTVRLPDEATKKRLQAEAARRGLDLADLLKGKGYVD